MAQYSAVINQRTEVVIATQVCWAHSWFGRLKGLLGTKTLDQQAGMWLSPCDSIHTIGMHYAIDVVFLDKDQQICRLAADIVPFRFCRAPRQAKSVLELASGRIQQTQLQINDRLLFKARSA